MRVDVTDLNFAYEHPKLILHGINFQVGSGDNLAILGASGCGKSTILKLIAGLISHGPAQVLGGKLLVGGCDVRNSPQDYRRLKRTGQIGYLSQHPILFDHLNVKENIETPLRIINRLGQCSVDNLIDLVGLGDHLLKLPAQLSGGMKTRVALARLFSTEPELLLLDEPFSSLDISRKSRIYAQFDALRGLNKATTIIVTHDIFEAILFSRHILVVNLNGTAQMYGVPNWKPNQSYESVVSRHYSCFTTLSDMIK